MSSSFRIAIVFLLTNGFPGKAQKPNQGIFIHDWEEKKFTRPVSVKFNDEIEKGPGIPINIDYSKKINKVSKYIFGINSTNFTGNYLEDPGLLNYLSLLKPGNIRFPGGDENIFCLASSFSSGSMGVVIINKSNDPHKVQ